jgi:enoyl-CoA hydratase
VDRDGVRTGRVLECRIRELLPVPGRPPLGEHETGPRAVVVEVGEAVAAVGLEADDERTVAPEVPGTPEHDRPLGSRRREQEHVACHEDHVEAAPELQFGEVRLDELDPGAPASSGAQHRRVEVDPDDLEATPHKLEGHASGTTACVEHRPRAKRADEVGLAVDLDALRCEPVEACLVVVTVPAHSQPSWRSARGLARWGYTVSVMPSNYEVLSIEREGHVATLFLDRPEKRNAMNMTFFAELSAAMAELAADQEIRAVVVAAKGPHFSVGLDLSALGEITGGGAQASERRAHEEAAPSPAELARRTHAEVLRLQAPFNAVYECPKPVIAAPHGYCLGGGVDLISSCDLRVCAADTVFSVRETKMAIVADLGSLQRLPLLIGMGQVAELALTGKDIDAARAERIGLVNEVFGDAEATLAGARAIAAEIAANSPVAVQGTKAVLAQIHRQQVDAGLRYVAAWNAGQLRSNDLTEAVTSFFERRPPEFTGT